MARALSDKNSAPRTVLGGTLIRWDRNDWRWRTGAREKVVRDFIVERKVPRRGDTLVVPRGAVDSTPQLQWIRGEHALGRATLDGNEFHVPASVWDEAWLDMPAGAEWDDVHEAAILQRAFELGWRPPRGFVSKAGWRSPNAGLQEHRPEVRDSAPSGARSGSNIPTDPRLDSY